jgi:hypothetical protein
MSAWERLMVELDEPRWSSLIAGAIGFWVSVPAAGSAADDALRVSSKADRVASRSRSLVSGLTFITKSDPGGVPNSLSMASLAEV